MIKKILIGLGIVIVAAGLAFGVIYFIKPPQSKSDDDKPSNVTVLDHSKNYGACELFDTSFVKTTLGDVAKNLQNPQNMGVTANKPIGEGVDDLVSDSQSCVYAFIPGGTIENGYNATNGLTIEQIIYTNESGPTTLIKQVETQGVATPVEGVAEAAFYDAVPKASGPNAIYSFKLEVFTAKSSTRYMIRQPADATTLFTADSAKAALIKLAKAAKQS